MKQYEFHYVPVPAEALRKIGIVPGILTETFVDGNRVIIQRAEDSECCDLFQTDCEACPYCCPSCGECLKGQMAGCASEEDEDE